MFPSATRGFSKLIIPLASAGLITSAADRPIRAAPPANDDCSNATPIQSEHVIITGTTMEATTDGTSLCGDSIGSPDVWYLITPAHEGTLRLGTCPSSLDTVLSVYVTCPGGPSTEIACGHGCNNGALCGPLFNTCLESFVFPGAPHWIRVAGNARRTGNFTLRVDLTGPPPPDNDHCAQATPITFEQGTISGTTLGATPDGFSSCAMSASSPDVWYRITPARPGVLDLLTCPSLLNAVISLFAACPGPASLELTCSATCNNGLLCGPSFVRCLSYPVVAGRTYWIRVGGNTNTTGNFSLNVNLRPSTPPTGDFNHDGAANGDDIQAFVGAVTTGSMTAADLAAGDFNGNGRIDADDAPGMVARLLAA